MMLVQPRKDGEVLAHRVAGGVEDGIDPHEGLLAVLEIREPGAELLEDAADVGMGQHRSLAHPRRPTGVDEGGDILPPGGDGDGVVRVLPDEVEERVDARSRDDLPVHLPLHEGVKLLFREGKIIVDVAGDNRLDLRCGLDLQRPGQQKVERHEEARIGVVELVFQLPLRVEGVVHHGDRAQPVAGVVGNDELGEVRHRDPFRFDRRRDTRCIGFVPDSLETHR